MEQPDPDHEPATVDAYCTDVYGFMDSSESSDDVSQKAYSGMMKLLDYFDDNDMDLDTNRPIQDQL